MAERNLTATKARAEVSRLGRTLDALGIIFGAPPWPRREDLSETGQALYDKIVDTAKTVARAISESRFDDALAVLATWTPLLNAFLDRTRVVGHDPSERLVRVYRYYLNQVADFSQITPASDKGPWTDAKALAYWNQQLSAAGRPRISLPIFLDRYTVLHMVHGVSPKDPNDLDWLLVQSQKEKP